jgi:hypothetical protein
VAVSFQMASSSHAKQMWDYLEAHTVAARLQLGHLDHFVASFPAGNSGGDVLIIPTP